MPGVASMPRMVRSYVDVIPPLFLGSNPMKRTLRRSVVLPALLAFGLSACGVFFAHGPPPGYEHMDHFQCTETNTAPVVDLVFGGLFLASTISIAVDPEEYAQEDATETAAVGIVWTVT